MKAIHEIPTKALQFDKYDKGSINTNMDFRLRVAEFVNTSFFVGAITKDGEARQETGGPMVQGPWAYIGQCATVVCTNGGSGADVRNARENGMLIEAKIGDDIKIGEDIYTIEYLTDHRGRQNRRYLQLTLNN